MDKKTKVFEVQSTTIPQFLDGSNYTYEKTKMKIFLTFCDFDL